MSKTPYAIIIRDGFGCNPSSEANAIDAAKTPTHDNLVANHPTGLIATSGEEVGLPPKTMGSSEVGHLNIGAGRVVFQSLARINKSIKDGDFVNNAELRAGIAHAKANNSTLHLMGLIQDAGVHAHSDHCKAILDLAKAQGLSSDQVVIHALTDGRDTAPQSTKTYLKVIADHIAANNFGRIVTVIGRFFAMDRDNRWDRVEAAYRAVAEGKSDSAPFDTWEAAVDDAYGKGENDEFIKPRLVGDYSGINDGDTMIFFNYRFDRTRELSKAFVLDGFDEFATKDIKDLDYLCMTNYYDGIDQTERANVSIVFKPITMDNILGEYLAKQGLTQVRVAETEKYPHVTFFFNGQTDIVYDGEERIGPSSPKVETYDQQPEMNEAEVTAEAVKAINSGKFDVMILNYANPDMVGHTGVFDAVVKACEAVDDGVGQVLDAILAKGGSAIVTADHGNCEQMIDYETGGPMTAHTLFDVWASVVSNREDLKKGAVAIRDGGRLADLAPTLLDMMGVEKPAEMTGETLLKRL